MASKALVVGVDKYPGNSLAGCVNDATAIAKLLTSEPYDFSVRLLLDEEVTRPSLKRELSRVLDADFSLIYFAGHGCKTNTASYLVTIDAEPFDEGVDFSYLTNTIKSVAKNNQNVIVILDCCHSGDATVRGGVALQNLERQDIPSISGSGRILIAACKGSEKAKEIVVNDEMHGLFTHYLIEALDGGAADNKGVVTILNVYEYIAAKFSEIDSSNQTPVLRGDQTGRIVLASGVKSENLGNSISSTSRYSEDETISQARNFVEEMHRLQPTYSHQDWKARGHLESCQRLAPILDWFDRRVAENPMLDGKGEFKGAYTEVLQQYINICNLSPGIVLNGEKVVSDFLGAGTFGSVWKIKQSNRQSDICFKSYHPNEIRDKDKVGRFKRGFEAMAQLNHPNIIKVHEYCKVPLGFYMQFIEGSNVRQYNPCSSMDLDQLIALLLVVGETLRHAHGRQVLHRDVKPENILIRFDDSGVEPVPYLTDFDLSWFSTATKLTRLAEGFGSHFYAAPEQMNNPLSPVAHKTTVDAYSFGQVMFFVIAGRDPAAFDEKGNNAAFGDCLRKYPVSEKIASMLLDLYKDCTRPSPSKREGDFRLICDRLSECLTIIRTTDQVLSLSQFLKELRYSISGLMRTDRSGQEAHGDITLSSPSSRSQITVTVKLETSDYLGLMVTVIPNEIIVPGASAQGARQTVNARVDAAMSKFARRNNARRSHGGAGSYQAAISFDGITKNADGLSDAREVIMAAVDAIEKT